MAFHRAQSSLAPPKPPLPCRVTQVAMGFGHSLFLVDGEDARVKELPEWEAEAIDKEGAPGAGAAGARVGVHWAGGHGDAGSGWSASRVAGALFAVVHSSSRGPAAGVG